MAAILTEAVGHEQVIVIRWRIDFLACFGGHQSNGRLIYWWFVPVSGSLFLASARTGGHYHQRRPRALRSDDTEATGSGRRHELMVTSIGTRIKPKSYFPAASVDQIEARKGTD